MDVAVKVQVIARFKVQGACLICLRLFGLTGANTAADIGEGNPHSDRKPTPTLLKVSMPAFRRPNVVQHNLCIAGSPLDVVSSQKMDPVMLDGLVDLWMTLPCPTSN